MEGNDRAATRLGPAGKVAKAFLRSKLTPLIVFASIVLGVGAVAMTPREEEPQIVVPMVDVVVAYPGASPSEVETQIATPLERKLWGIPGVEYLYSTSIPNAAMLTVRFKVNEPLEASLVKVTQEVTSHPELLPSGAMPPVIRLLTIDDVPFLTLTLRGPSLPAGELRKLADEVAREIASVPSTAQVQVLGGARRTLRIEPDPDRMRTLGVSIAEIEPVLRASNAQLPAGAVVDGGKRLVLEARGQVLAASELRRTVVANRGGRPVYLEDVARVVDGPEPEPPVVLFAARGDAGFEQAVTVVVAKRAGTNATELADRVLEKVEHLRGALIPSGVDVTVTRNYGETAGEKSNELIEHLLIATLSVIGLILLAMGWRSALVVAVAVPVTLALTLLLSYLLGYTLNRVTLFALIFSIGILVDDAIVVVENIHRHIHMPGPRRSFGRLVVEAVDEVGNPTILATFAVIAAILPMAFVRGLMGPYMRPIPVGASLAMLFSLVIAFVVSPWMSLIVFRKEASRAEGEAGHAHDEAKPESRATVLHRKVTRWMIGSSGARWLFLAAMLVLLGGAGALVATRVVKVKMLPFDNKSEFQVQLDLPAGTPREEALAVGQDVARRILEVPEVKDVQVYAGVAAPFTFVGMVRHSFLRVAAEQVDVQVALVPKGDRKAKSHDIAMRLRPAVEAIAHPAGARVKIVEIPPGPPVLDTLVAEVFGPTASERNRLAAEIQKAFASTAGVVDIDSTINPTAPRMLLLVDREMSSLHGVPPAAVVQTLAAAGYGAELGTFRAGRGGNLVPVVLQLPPALRTNPEALLELTAPGMHGPVPLSELVRVREGSEEPAIFHENLMPVAYVMGDLAGAIESPVYAIAELQEPMDALRSAGGEAVPRTGLSYPQQTERPAVKWDGEWHITLEVFRDLGLAFAAVLVLIYVLVVGWFESFTIPLIILAPIPLSLIGILPAHGALGIFFTATSMIGFIAGAGIMLRNSIILVDFIELKLREGMPLEQAVEEAGVVRFRPMVLTAAAVVVGSAVMLTDPIFQGLAVSLIAGQVAATLLSRLAVPVLYWLVARHGRAAELQREGALAREGLAARDGTPGATGNIPLPPVEGGAPIGG